MVWLFQVEKMGSPEKKEWYLSFSYCEEIERLFLITENPSMITPIVITKMSPYNFGFELNQNLFRKFLSIRSSSTGILVIETSFSFLLNFIDIVIRYFSV